MLMPPEMPTVLLVEDSDEDADTVAIAFARSGVNATLYRVMGGDACIAWLKRSPHTPALVIMDLNTPGTDGRQTLHWIKSDPVLKSIPVVVSSTSSSSQRSLSTCPSRSRAIARFESDMLGECIT